MVCGRNLCPHGDSVSGSLVPTILELLGIAYSEHPVQRSNEPPHRKRRLQFEQRYLDAGYWLLAFHPLKAAVEPQNNTLFHLRNWCICDRRSRTEQVLLILTPIWKRLDILVCSRKQHSACCCQLAIHMDLTTTDVQIGCIQCRTLRRIFSTLPFLEKRSWTAREQ